MAERPHYELNTAMRLANALMGTLGRLGVGPGKIWLLTTFGRKTGKRRTTPVSLVEDGAERWLVAPYGVRPWVLNVRAAGTAELRRGRRRERVTLAEVHDAAAAAPVLKRYLAGNSVTSDYFDATPESDLAAFAAESDRHPVFRIGTAETA